MDVDKSQHFIVIWEMGTKTGGRKCTREYYAYNQKIKSFACVCALAFVMNCVLAYQSHYLSPY